MKLMCNAHISNRLLPSFNMKKNSGGQSAAQLSIGRNPGSGCKGDIFLLFCTKHNRSGTKYKLKGNLQQIFAKFVHEGKATLSFAEPPHDICLNKADPLLLKNFLVLLRKGKDGGTGLEKVTLSSLAPVSNKSLEKMRTKMAIMCKQDYPVTTGFPRSLERLQINSCTLKRIESRILQLSSLRVLDVSKNSIHILPDNWETLPNLTELRLSENDIERVPPKMCTGSLSKSLALLDLRGNKITDLGSAFSKLTCLVTLYLDFNELYSLPEQIGNLVNLKFLHAQKNYLSCLPGSFVHLNLHSLDLFGNSFQENDNVVTENKLTFPTLFESAARAIKKHRIVYTLEDLPRPLIHFLSTAKWCLCGGACFDSFVHYCTKFDLRKKATEVTGLDRSGRVHAPVEGYLCSEKCFRRYQKNPHASFWR